MKHHLHPQWSLVNTSGTEDPTPYTDPLFDDHRIKPDLTLYPFVEEDDKTPYAPRAECFGEFNIAESDDPFTNPRAVSVESPAAAGMRTRNQIAWNSAAIQATQFRTRVFTFYVRGTTARLICHSRTGMEVTDLFDWTDSKHHYLHEFFWRLSHADLEHRGYDTTFRQFTSSDDPQTWAAVRDKFFRSNMAKDDPIYEVQVDGTKLYVSFPFTNTHVYPVGRGTRCFSAYDPALNRLVLLKHTWRDAAYEPEHIIYARLVAHRVRHIPNVIAFADMPGCFSTCEDGQGRRQILYCLVLSVIGRPLTTIKSSYQLVQVVRDCVEGKECYFVWFASISDLYSTPRCHHTRLHSPPRHVCWKYDHG